jgi:hypothetical protein
MRAPILFLVFLFIVKLSSGQADEKVTAIRKLVQAINNDRGYKIKKLDNDYFTDVKNEAADNGQELKGYYKDGQLKKIIYTVGLSNCMKTYGYYFSGNNLIFVFEKEDDYPAKKDGSGPDDSKLVPGFEGRYYIENGKIIQAKTKGQERSVANDNNRFNADLKGFLEDLKHGR